MLAKGCALRPGATIIKAALVTAVESEVAGQAVAQVSEDVYDADGVGRLLIPAGTRVVGVYKTGGGMSFDRKRLDFGWTEMTLPDGTQIDLGKADGGDASGRCRRGRQGDDAWGNVIATAALLSVFDAMATVPASTTGDPTAAAIATSVGNSTSEVGREVTRRALSIEPKMSIPPAHIVTIFPRSTVQVCGWCPATFTAWRPWLFAPMPPERTRNVKYQPGLGGEADLLEEERARRGQRQRLRRGRRGAARTPRPIPPSERPARGAVRARRGDGDDTYRSARTIEASCAQASRCTGSRSSRWCAPRSTRSRSRGRRSGPTRTGR